MYIFKRNFKAFTRKFGDVKKRLYFLITGLRELGYKKKKDER